MKFTVLSAKFHYKDYRNNGRTVWNIVSENGDLGVWDTGADTKPGRIHNDKQCKVNWNAKEFKGELK